MTISEGALVWPIASSLSDYPEDGDEALTKLAESVAVEWLWGLTARIYGTFPAAYRPQTRLLTVCVADWPSFLQSIYGPLWGSGWPYTGDPRYDGLGVKQVVELVGPVVAPTVGSPATVQIYDPTTGAETDLSSADTTPAFRIVGNYLVREDGGTWPETQNMIAKLGDKNTWVVNYTRGVPVPDMGQAAAALLANEFLKAFVGDKSCRIPMNATTVTRGQVTINRDILKATKTTGVALVDQWVAMVNPNGLQQAPQVWSPDTSRNARPFAGSYAPTN